MCPVREKNASVNNVYQTVVLHRLLAGIFNIVRFVVISCSIVLDLFRTDTARILILRARIILDLACPVDS